MGIGKKKCWCCAGWWLVFLSSFFVVCGCSCRVIVDQQQRVGFFWECRCVCLRDSRFGMREIGWLWWEQKAKGMQPTNKKCNDKLCLVVVVTDWVKFAICRLVWWMCARCFRVNPHCAVWDRQIDDVFSDAAAVGDGARYSESISYRRRVSNPNDRIIFWDNNLCWFLFHNKLFVASGWVCLVHVDGRSNFYLYCTSRQLIFLWVLSRKMFQSQLDPNFFRSSDSGNRTFCWNFCDHEPKLTNQQTQTSRKHARS